MFSLRRVLISEGLIRRRLRRYNVQMNEYIHKSHNAYDQSLISIGFVMHINVSDRQAVLS